MAVIYLDTQQHTIMITRRGFQNYKTLKKGSVTKFSTLIFSLSLKTLYPVPCTPVRFTKIFYWKDLEIRLFL